MKSIILRQLALGIAAASFWFSFLKRQPKKTAKELIWILAFVGITKTKRYSGKPGPCGNAQSIDIKL